MTKFDKKQLTKKSEDFSQWYIDLVQKADLADYSPVKGCMVIKPYGYAIWENMKNALDEKIKQAGVKNAYFPIFIPESFLEKEQEHVEGFSPELAVVTHGGGKELEEKLAVRPTSETMIYNKFADWIQSWRDLPYKINQWANIVRWEKRTYFFLRTTEFLWQEGHTAHATHQSALEEVERALQMYIDLFENYLAIPGVSGKKSQYDKFPGAIDTFAFESLMPDGKALQSCTSHDLGQNFSKPFEIQFQDQERELKHVWQTCWGFSTRAMGSLIMVHGDDYGLVLPPKIAPIQVVIIPITGGEENKQLAEYVKELQQKLEAENLRVKVDHRSQYRPGYKFNEWELKGVPLRIELGSREMEEETLTFARRDTRKKEKVSAEKAVQQVEQTLDSIQQSMYDKADQFLQANTHQVDEWEEFKRIMKENRGFIKALWCGGEECEQQIKEETKAETRCLDKEEEGKCIHCGKPATHRWIFAQSY